MARYLDTEALGIYPSDVIIRSAFKLALDDLRRNNYLLDYAFQALAHDDESRADYGEQEIENARQWFLRTKIRVGSVLRREDANFPLLTFDLMSSAEQAQEGTLGDTHYVPFEPIRHLPAPVLAGPLTPVSYVAATGTLTFDPAALKGLVVVEGMVVRDASGAPHPIVAVTQDNVFQVAPGTVADFQGAMITGSDPAMVHGVESAVFQEQVAIGCHVDSEPVHLLYLHAIAVFILKRYNQALFEARGFERMTISSANLRLDETTDPEFIYSRYVQVTGSVRQSWPKTPLMAIQSTTLKLTASPAAQVAPATPIPEGDDEVDAGDDNFY